MDGKVQTGIPGLDELLGGGMRSHSVCLVAGASGTGKTTLGMQFLYEGANTYNEPGLLISFEEDKRQISDYFTSFSWDLGLLESKRKLVVLEYPAQEISHFMAQEVLIHDTISENGIKRVVVDSLTTFALLYETSHKRRQEIVKLLRKLRKWGCTTIVTSEAKVDGNGNPTAMFDLEALCDGIIYLYNLRSGTSRQRALEVVKMRGVSHDTRIHPMEFTKKGLSANAREPLKL